MHQPFMHRCLALAEQGRGKTGINPMVGAVLVRPAGRVKSEKWKVENELIIGEGYHQAFGGSHAELQLFEKLDPTSPLRLRGAGQKISSSDILYVSLEPCCHSHKKTPPCAQMLIEKGIKNIVIGMQDPNPEVAGKGIELLRSNDVNVSIAFALTADCLRLNRGFVSLMTKGRPWITLKQARTTDGRIANDEGSPLRITSKTQDEWSHSKLRAKHDAILVGIGTVLRDDPELTVRYTDNPPEIFRIILDASLQIPLTARVVRRGTIVIASSPDQKKI